MVMLIKAARKGAEPRPHVPPPRAEPDAPEFSPPVDPEILPSDLRTRRDVAYAHCLTNRFEAWLAQWIAFKGWARDEVEPAALLLTCYVREMLLAAAVHPELFPARPGEVEEDTEEVYEGPQTELDAAYYNLSVRPGPAKRKRLRPTMPGCWGKPQDRPCGSLRIRGHKFCPACERAERQKIRESQGRD